MISAQAQADTATPKSKLALAIEQRKRKVYEFEVQGFFGLGDKQIEKIAVRVATKKEQDDAIVAAYQQIHNAAAGGAEQIKNDEDYTTDAKTIQILFKVCRRCEPGDADRDYMYPAFPSPNWMWENLTTDQLAVLLNLANEVRRKEGPVSWEISYDQIEALAAGCAAVSSTDMPDVVLARFNREWLSHAFVLLSSRLIEERRDRDSNVLSENVDGRHSGGTEKADEAPAGDAPGHAGYSEENGEQTPIGSPGQ